MSMVTHVHACMWLWSGGKAASGILRSSNYDVSRALPRRNKVIMPSSHVERGVTVVGEVEHQNSDLKSWLVPVSLVHAGV